MELSGNEKKIQALFRELKLADERVAPGFIKVWNRAQATSPRSSRVFNLSFGVATALFLITASALALWSRNTQRSVDVNPKVATGATITDSAPSPPAPIPAPKHVLLTQSPVRVKSNRWDWKLAARREASLDARNTISREAVSISSWQSPTANLMQSAANDMLTSLPQLDRSFIELKTFLPNTPAYQNRER